MRTAAICSPVISGNLVQINNSVGEALLEAVLSSQAPVGNLKAKQGKKLSVTGKGQFFAFGDEYLTSSVFPKNFYHSQERKQRETC